MATKFFRGGHNPDYIVLAIVVILTIFGLVMLASASFELGKIKFNDTYYYIKHQALYGLLIGLVGFFLTLKLNYRIYQKFAFILLLVSLSVLVLVFTSFGYVAGGAGRWLQLGPITFQPAEILKITFVLYLAAWLSSAKHNRAGNFLEGFLPFLIIIGLIGGLLVMQPATSTVVILIGAGLAVYFMSGARVRYVALVVLLGIFALGLIVYATPYRRERVLTFLNQGAATESSGYHIKEALITLGSGGLFGIGYGKSLAKTSRLPASINDSIFAVIGSELGFIGAGSLVVIFGFLTVRILWLAKNMREKFGRLVLIGFAFIIGIQALINMAAISGFLPLTGVPLPFISYGGTALAVFLTMSGIIVNISKFV